MKRHRYTYIISIAALSASCLLAFAGKGTSYADVVSKEVLTAPEDTLVTPVKTTTVTNINQKPQSSGDLKDPENIKSDVYFDEQTGTYRMGTKLGSSE